MVTENIKVTRSSGVLDYRTLLKDVTEETTQDAVLTPIEPTAPKRDYLTAEDDPVLAKLWDNDDDAIFDAM
jgi:hypothetical protein